MTDNTATITVDGREFTVAHVGDVLRVAPAGSDELAETVSLGHLTDEARQALERGDNDDAAVRIAAEGLARAIADRGA